MLEITILKDIHAGERRARKLLPYIQQCDVFGFESAFASKTHAELQEAKWEKIVKSDISLSKFRELNLHNKQRAINPPQVWEYKAKVYEYVFRQKKPLWHVERFSDEEAASVYARYQELIRLSEERIAALLQNHIERYLQMSHVYLKRFEEECVAPRDRHIAQQLKAADESIREKFQNLKMKNPLKFCMFVGNAHRPEIYLDFPVIIKDLSDPEDKERPDHLVIESYRNGRYNDLQRHLLSFGVEALSERKYINLTNQQIKKMNFKELSEVIKTLKVSNVNRSYTIDQNPSPLYLV